MIYRMTAEEYIYTKIHGLSEEDKNKDNILGIKRVYEDEPFISTIPILLESNTASCKI